MSPQRQKEKTFDLLLDWLRALAARQPVLFVVEDLHWAGPMTLEFLDLLLGQTQGDRVLTVLTARPEFQPSWRSRAAYTQVTLNPLTRRQTGELLAVKTGLSQVPPEVVAQVAERTDGVPLFVEEFAAMLQAGSLYTVGGTPQLADVFEDHVIPATLHDLLLARLERAAGNFEVVQLAAVVGREFSYELLQAVAPCAEEALQRELAKLVDAELLFARGRSPQTRYQFKHALIRDAAYQSLLKKKRQQFHVRIAEALEQCFPETCVAQPELLAQHFAEGNALSRAVAYWERAGERAQQRGCPECAIGHFRRGLELSQSLPATLERHDQEIRLHISLGVALTTAKGTGVAELEATYARAHTLCLETGLTEQVFPALFGRLRYCINRARYADAQGLAEEMLRLAERDANAGFLVCAHCALGWALLFQGKHTEALPHLERVVAVEATAELRSAVHRYVVVDPWVSSHLYLSLALWLLGFPERSAERSRQALSMAERLGHPFSLASALSYVSWLHQFRQDRERARTTAARALALGTENGFASVISWGRILCGWAVVEPGQCEPGLAEIRQGLEDLRLQAALRLRHEMLPLLAEASARAGRPEEGLKALAEALEFADATGETFLNAELHRLKGELLWQHDPNSVAAAETCFHQALEVARRQQARSLELRAAMSLARLWLQQGKPQAAYELLAPVYASFTEGFQTHDLQRAAALLEQYRSSAQVQP
jgi:predicted ATPase